jgi:single-strand DNA-binding protein
MNNLSMIGRVAKEPEIRYSNGATSTAYGSYTLAVDRPTRKDADKITDFIYCKLVGGPAEFAEKYLRKGMKIAITGRVQVDNYKDRDGNNKSTTYVQVLSHEFCESKNTTTQATAPEQGTPVGNDDFFTVPDDVESELPF